MVETSGGVPILTFSIRRNNDKPGQLRTCQFAPTDIFEDIGGSEFQARSGETFVANPDFLGSFLEIDPKGRFATLQTTEIAIVRLAQLLAAHAPVVADVTVFATPDMSAGFIQTFVLPNITITG